MGVGEWGQGAGRRFPGGSTGKESAYNPRNPGSVPGLGRFLGEGKGYPLQCSGLENAGSQSRTQFSLCYICVSWASLVAQVVKHLPAMQETRVRFLSWEDPLEKEMATHAGTLAWKIPWTEEPGRLQTMGLQTVRDD